MNDAIVGHIVTIVAIISIAVVVTYALSKGIDGAFLASGLAVIAGLGGYKVAQSIQAAKEAAGIEQ